MRAKVTGLVERRLTRAMNLPAAWIRRRSESSTASLVWIRRVARRISLPVFLGNHTRRASVEARGKLRAFADIWNPAKRLTLVASHFGVGARVSDFACGVWKGYGGRVIRLFSAPSDQTGKDESGKEGSHNIYLIIIYYLNQCRGGYTCVGLDTYV